ncbi:hypothetical protein Despr_0414 [Desulfobulbus propionicus DSM 2032]|jgi:hypothetical protein|uniref:Uncharacterized protein n=1 Tax=Desulfobulbus propionicus (strain ATCC 33891 / DSM 2032 / VKM B-1956 / 1pr3) TaxID=577650 RepID=A0A7U3YJL3_DESPD|nr:hypothetical protein [Desulfobulbus propionicus]ADW16596.1 hypothetical protein Despr_0414 [Desulfobulbus propionicus DSM 2032]
MTYHDSLILFGLFLVFLGFGLLIYCQLLSLFARIHTRLFPLMYKSYQESQPVIPEKSRLT